LELVIQENIPLGNELLNALESKKLDGSILNNINGF
jgi:hypothetical protein